MRYAPDFVEWFLSFGPLQIKLTMKTILKAPNFACNLTVDLL